MSNSQLIGPYGGSMVNLLVPEDEKEELKSLAAELPSIRLSDRAACDLELLATGAFSPLDRFMGADDHARVLAEMRLSDGKLWPIPVTLPVDEHEFRLDDKIALRDSGNEILAVMEVEEAYEWDPAEVSRLALGTEDARHPLVSEMAHWGRINISGKLRVLALPRRFDFPNLRLTPSECRRRLEEMGNPDVVAFQTRNPMHRAHEELTKRAISAVGGALLLHPAVGMTKPGDTDHYTRVRTYQAMMGRYYDPSEALLSLLPLAMRMAGPREALWHAIIRRNYGANHLIVGRDHAGPGSDSTGRPFYGPDDARQLVEEHSEEVGVKAVSFDELVYLPNEDRYEEVSEVKSGTTVWTMSGSRARAEYLDRGLKLPEWFTRPEVSEILLKVHQPGACVWFTGLSGAGKSTVADALTAMLMERGGYVSVLDGDVVRTHLSKGLGFSREDRDTNILRIGFVASEVAAAGGLVIVAAISPYRATREAVKKMVGPDRFVEVYVNTPLEVCEARDTKGMYAKARRGEIKNFTGIDDPYEPPENPDVELETVCRSPQDNARIVLGALERMVPSSARTDASPSAS